LSGDRDYFECSPKCRTLEGKRERAEKLKEQKEKEAAEEEEEEEEFEEAAIVL
jgi:hypothetical protein